MEWHVICRVGNEDGYTPVGKYEPYVLVGINQPGEQREAAHDLRPVVQDQLGRTPSGIAADLLHLAIGVYTADLRVMRRFGADRWTREFVLHCPVSAVDTWKAATEDVERMLEFLTGDRWSVRFRSAVSGNSSVTEQTSLTPAPDVVSLFSGGLDSLVGAIDLLATGKRVALVSHYGGGMAHATQEDLFAQISDEYGERVTLVQFYVQPPRMDGDEGEQTMRSRSLLFLALGTFVASAIGQDTPLVVAENGLISLNVPLTNARLGSFSTRTTHPHFLTLFTCLLKRLNIQNALEMPYRFCTKGEMLQQAKNADLLRVCAPLSMSCAHPEAGRFQGGSPTQHCGYCVPCLIRRAAMTTAGLDDGEYRVDVRSNPPAANTESGRDLRAFEMAIERMEDADRRTMRTWLQSSGPIAAEDFASALGVYDRGLQEVRRFLA